MPPLRLARGNRRRDHYRRFPETEYDRRWDAVYELMDREGYDAVVVHGNSHFQTTLTEYLTNYSPPFATYLVAFADPEVAPTMYVGVSNHLQYVREVSEIDDLRLMLHDPGRKLVSRLREGGAGEGTVGLAGFDPRYDLGLPWKHYRQLEESLDADLVDATVPFTHLTAVKSDAELERVRRAAEVLDGGMAALADEAEPGMSEEELQSVVQSALSHDGGGLNNAFISTAPMEGAESGEPLPWKSTPSKRTLQDGDVITTEISANDGGYASQIHRPYAVGGPPTDAYRDIFEVAEETCSRMVEALQPGNTARDVYEAMAPVEESEFKIYDVMLHGYGNGYLHPFLGTKASNYWPGDDDPVSENWTFEPGMVMVVQPNVVTEDERHALQLGTTVIVGDDGPEDVHDFPVEFVRA